MEKYVCDFDGVRAVCKDLHTAASDMNGYVGTYNENIQSDLGGWEGVAKNAFISSLSEQIDRAIRISGQLDGVASGIEKAVDAIQELESSISSLEIE